MSDRLVATVDTSVLTLGLGDTLPAPAVGLIDEDGQPADASGITGVVMHFDDIRPAEYDADGNQTYTPLSFTVNGARVDTTSFYRFPLSAVQTAAARSWRTKVVITEAGGTYTFPTADVLAVDYASLWGDPVEVARLAPGHSTSEYVAAILAAEAAVRAWVTTSISSPVSERVSYAVALLASRALTASPAGTNVVSETMGDYTVRFARTAPGGLFVTDDIAELLKPWRSGFGSSYTGPDGTTTDLFFTVEDEEAAV